MRGKSRRSPHFPERCEERKKRGPSSPSPQKGFSTVHVRTTNARRNKHVCSFFPGILQILVLFFSLFIYLAFVNLAISTTFLRCMCAACCWPGYFPLVTSSGCTRQGTGERVVQPTMYPRATQEPVYTCRYTVR